MWHGPLFVSGRIDPFPVLLYQEAEFVSEYVYNERQILIDAMENWLTTLREERCEHLFCYCGSAESHIV